MAWGDLKVLRIGGLVAVGFLDEERLLVGSHSGLGIFNARAGSLLDRVDDIDGDYAWLQDSPPTATYIGEQRHEVPVAGLWGGSLPTSTADGWTCRLLTGGAEVTGPGLGMRVEDDEELMASGFSAEGRVFVYATSPQIHVAVRVEAECSS